MKKFELTPKRYQMIKLIMVVILSIAFSQAFVLKNFFIPIVLSIIVSSLLIYLRKRVTGILNDERDFAIGGKAAMLSIQIYSWIAVISMFAFYALEDINPFYESIAITLAFSTCILMLLYSLIYRYYHKISFSDKKTIFVFVVLVLFLIMFIGSLRIFSGEDTWMCENGEWIEHGHPDFPVPTRTCK